MGASPQPEGLGSWLVGGAIKSMLSVITSTVDAGAAGVLRLTGSMLNSTTNPGLLSTWFSSTYWRVAALSALLTLPFLFAAAVHALVRSDLTLLARAAFGYLPLAAIGVTIAAPIAALLLSATDEMCSLVAGAAGNADGAALGRAATGILTLSGVTDNPMLAFVVGLLMVGTTIWLWIELLIRAAAVDVIVLMLPLFFAAMVWPARRVWAVRSIEMLIALILAKFAIVAVLTLGGAAFGGASSGLSSTLVGVTLIVLAACSPWALLRLLPLHEVAAAAAGGLNQAPRAFADGTRDAVLGGLRTAGGAQGADGDGLGLGTEHHAELAMARTATGGAGDARGFDPLTAAGLTAVERSGSRAARRDDGGGAGAGGFGEAAAFDEGTGVAGATTAGPGPGGALVMAHTDERPPISHPFGQGEWEPLVIGEQGDEVMEPARFVSDPPPEPEPGRVPEPEPGHVPEPGPEPPSVQPDPPGMEPS